MYCVLSCHTEPSSSRNITETVPKSNLILIFVFLMCLKDVCECMCMFVNVCDMRVCMWLINVVLSVVQPRIMQLFSIKAPLKKHTMHYSFRQKLHCCTLNLTPLWPLSQAAIRLHRRCTYSLIHRKHYDHCSDTLIDSVWWNSDFQKRATVVLLAWWL